MPADHPLVIVQLTPSGRGAIATCLVSGRDAVTRVAPLVQLASGRPLDALPSGQIAVGQWRGSLPEELVVVCQGADEVTLHCHGGRVAVSTIMSDLAAAGGQVVDWKVWLADQSNRITHGDPFATAAVIALSQAHTERCAAILLDQFHGALRAELQELSALLRDQKVSQAAERVDVLLSRAPLGMHLDTPWRVAICGPPNVGKSSLINALVGYGRAIVAPQPGTTRDVVSALTAIDGWPIELSDTAGLHDADDALEAAGIAVGRQHAARADLRLLVLDRSAPWGATEQGLAAALPDAMIVHNKCDLMPQADSRPAGIELSALTREGMQQLLEAIAERLVPSPPPAGSGVPFRRKHVSTLGEMKVALFRNDLAGAQKQLNGLLPTEC